MMTEGLIIEWKHGGCSKWVVVNVNDCRATVVPMTGKDPNNPDETFEEAHPSATGISPNSLCKVLGRVTGHIKKREKLIRSSMPVRVEKPVAKVIKAALPSIPEDPAPIDPVLASVLTSTRELFS